MKPAPFAYTAPASLADACGVLAEHGDEAKVLAGGQSLGPMLNLRLATPELVVDLNRIGGLDMLEEQEGAVRVGALVRQRDVERSEHVTRRVPLLAEALPWVGHAGIRNRGTVVGSVAHADPAAELPSVAVALDAQVVAVSVRGQRVIRGAELYEGVFTTSLEPDEILSEVRFPTALPGTGFAWLEFAQRHGDFALVGVAAALGLDQQGRCRRARLVYAGVGPTPFDAADAASVLIGAPPSAESIAGAADRAARDAEPREDIFAGPEYRRRLVRALTARALHTAAERAGAADAH